MRITGFHGFFGPQRHSGASGAHGSKDVSRAAATNADTSAAHAANLESASDLTKLQRQLREFPEIRPDRIEAVRTRLADGLYDTRQAAEATADAILGGFDRS